MKCYHKARFYMKALTKEWIDKAEEDFRVAQREMLGEPPSYNAVCFHSQQSVEKYLKAVLQENDVVFLKVHDLEVLVDQVNEFISNLNALKDDARRLNVFAVEVRYPGFEAEDEDARSALESLERLVKAIRDYFRGT